MNEQQAKENGYQYFESGMRKGEGQLLYLKERLQNIRKDIKPFGSKAAIVKQVSEYRFRDRRKRQIFYNIWIQYSEAHKTFMKEQMEKRNREVRQQELRRIACGCTLQELAWMFQDKVDRLEMQHEAREAQEAQR